jgi:hypothetical protein
MVLGTTFNQGFTLSAFVFTKKIAKCMKIIVYREKREFKNANAKKK